MVKTVADGAHCPDDTYPFDCTAPQHPNYVTVDHGSGIYTCYLHLETLRVSVGDQVGIDTVLGNTGPTSENYWHVRFEVENGAQSGKQVDPGRLTACVGGATRTYPAYWGKANWNQVTHGQYYTDNDGCPPPSGGGGVTDRDGDGVSDGQDRCPDNAGRARLGGCPGADNDEVADLDDRCEHVAGFVQSAGCPESQLSYVAPTRIDANGDGRADYCRRVGGQNGVDSHISCTYTTATGFGATASAGPLDWGYDIGRAWADANGDGKADFCRIVGGENGVDSRVQCTLSTGAGFGDTWTSPVLDWGYETGRAWVDANGDGRADYRRRVGGQNGANS